VLFAVANLARHCKVDPEAALRSTNDKFEKRFRYVEQQLAARAASPPRPPRGDGSALAGSQDRRPEPSL
jgi:ATP diphosphatase